MKACPSCHHRVHRPPWRGGGSFLPHFGFGPRCPGAAPSAAGRTAGRRAAAASGTRSGASRPRARPAAGPRSAGRSPPSKTARCRPPTIRACSRISSTASSHLVRNASVRPGGPGPGGQLRLAEVEPPGDRQEPGGLVGVLQQRPAGRPSCAPARWWPGWGSGRCTRGRCRCPRRARPSGGPWCHRRPRRGSRARVRPGAFSTSRVRRAGDGVGPPGAVLGEGLQRLPVGGPLDGR